MMQQPGVDISGLQAAAVQASQLLKAIANEYRLMILCNLLEGEKQVAELHETIDLSQSSMSQHLSRLRQEGLVITRRQSQAIFYTLSSPEVRQIMTVLYDIYCKPAKNAGKKTAGGRVTRAEPYQRGVEK